MNQNIGIGLRLALLTAVLTVASGLSLAHTSGVVRSAQHEDSLLRLAAQLPPNMGLQPLAAHRIQWSADQLDCDFITCLLWMKVDRAALQPGDVSEVEYAAHIGGMALLYAEDATLTLESADGRAANFGPDEQVVLTEENSVRIVNNSRGCATLISVTLSLQAGTGAGVPPAVGSGPQLPTSSAERCSGEPESFYMVDGDPAANTLLFVARLTWFENWEPGLGPDPFLDRHSHDGSVALIVDSGLLSVFGGGPDMHLADGWVEIAAGTPVSLMRITAIEEWTSALFIGAVDADDEILLPSSQ